MTVLRNAVVAIVLASGVIGAAPAAAVITTFAQFEGVGGANMYWNRSGTTYAPATSTTVIASHVIAVPTYAVATRGHPLTSGQKASNAALLLTYNAAITAQIPIQTAANAAAALATAGGQFFTIAAPGDTTAGSVATKFSFLAPSPSSPLEVLAGLGSLKASFTFLGTAAAGTPVNATVAGFGFDIQSLTSGSFSFIYTGLADLTVYHTVYHTGANLLTATFTKGAITGSNGATSGSNTDSTTGANAGSIVYTSDFLNFIATNHKDYSISATSITAPLGFGLDQALNSFKATTTGSFSTDPQPITTAIVPEPAVWGLLIVGFGMVGLQTRRRARATSVIA